MYVPFLSLLDLAVPVIGALNGHAVGGGFGLSLVCDLRIGAREAKYGANFVKLGLAPGMSISYLLPRLDRHGARLGAAVDRSARRRRRGRSGSASSIARCLRRRCRVAMDLARDDRCECAVRGAGDEARDPPRARLDAARRRVSRPTCRPSRSRWTTRAKASPRCSRSAQPKFTGR